MEILLKQDVKGVGHAGDIKKVANGYARNYLIPKGLACPANKGAAKQAQQIKSAAERKESASTFRHVVGREDQRPEPYLPGPSGRHRPAVWLDDRFGHRRGHRASHRRGDQQTPDRAGASASRPGHPPGARAPDEDIVPEVTVLIEREGEAA